MDPIHEEQKANNKVRENRMCVDQPKDRGIKTGGGKCPWFQIRYLSVKRMVEVSWTTD